MVAGLPGEKGSALPVAASFCGFWTFLSPGGAVSSVWETIFQGGGAGLSPWERVSQGDGGSLSVWEKIFQGDGRDFPVWENISQGGERDFPVWKKVFQGDEHGLSVWKKISQGDKTAPLPWENLSQGEETAAAGGKMAGKPDFAAAPTIKGNLYDFGTGFRGVGTWRKGMAVTLRHDDHRKAAEGRRSPRHWGVGR